MNFFEPIITFYAVCWFFQLIAYVRMGYKIPENNIFDKKTTTILFIVGAPLVVCGMLLAILYRIDIFCKRAKRNITIFFLLKKIDRMVKEKDFSEHEVNMLLDRIQELNKND